MKTKRDAHENSFSLFNVNPSSPELPVYFVRFFSNCLVEPLRCWIILKVTLLTHTPLGWLLSYQYFLCLCWKGCREIGTPYTVGEHVKWCIHCGKHVSSEKLQIKLSSDPAIPLLSMLWTMCLCPPKFMCWRPNSRCDGIWRWSLWEVIRGLDEDMSYLILKN